MAHVDDLIQRRPQQVFLTIIPRFAIASPNADDPPSGNHESLESRIPNRKKARPNTRLSCNIEYFIQTSSAYLSSRFAFFTDDQPKAGLFVVIPMRQAGLPAQHLSKTKTGAQMRWSAARRPQ